MKNFIFGDTGGHMKQLFGALKDIGVDTLKGTIPEDVRIIHLGDLIHKGPHSNLLVRKIDMFMDKNPGQWVQLFGNHEFQHIDGAPVFWRCDCSDETIETLNKWYRQGSAKATFGIESFTKIEAEALDKTKINFPQTGVFLSHASLTWDWWNVFGRETNPVLLSETLNALETHIITTPGEMLGAYGRKPGPVWAIGNSEVFDSWADKNDIMPFIQIHGHTTSYRWGTKNWWRNDKAFLPFKKATKLNLKSRAVITSMAGNLLIGIDPGYANTADGLAQPYFFIES